MYPCADFHLRVSEIVLVTQSAIKVVFFTNIKRFRAFQRYIISKDIMECSLSQLVEKG